MIAEFESLEAAQAWAEADPYVAAGVYAQVSVKPYKKYFKTKQNRHWAPPAVPFWDQMLWIANSNELR